MPLPSRRRIKKELNRKLMYYPLLRMLLLKEWFRYAFLAALAAMLFLVVYLPKIWRTSPSGFNPVVKISGLDFTQCWSLKRAARKAASERKFSEAYVSWQAAVAQNPGDLSAVRGFLENFKNLTHPSEKETITAIGQSFWLLRLTKTNAADAVLCAKLYEQFGWHDVMIYAFPNPETLLPEARVAYAKALFHQGRIKEFGKFVTTISEPAAQDALKLYKLAHLAGWGTGQEAVEALATLENSAAKGEEKSKATRLLLPVYAARKNVVGYQKALQSLEAANAASVADHVVYWKLLASTGSPDEARTLADRFTTAPSSAMEMLKLANVYFTLGQVEHCRELMKKFAPQFGHSPEVWLSYASVLEDLKDWNGMRAAALQIREIPNYQEKLGGFSFYIEGRAEMAQERITTAEIAFRKASQSSFEAPALGLEIAQNLTKLKYAKFARPILENIEDRLKSSRDYWDACFNAAFFLKDPAWILKASEADYNLAPEDVNAVNRYAAALMVNREKPEEAVQLTLRIVSRFPQSATAVINHASALLLNKRYAGAKSYLERVVPAGLNPVETSAYALAMFELAMQEQRYADARRFREAVMVDSLFPAQKEWLLKRTEEIPESLSSKS